MPLSFTRDFWGTFKIEKRKRQRNSMPEFFDSFKGNFFVVRYVTGNDEDYLRKIPRVVVQKSALL